MLRSYINNRHRLIWQGQRQLSPLRVYVSVLASIEHIVFSSYKKLLRLDF